MLLSVENLHVSYDRIKALHGISLGIDEGEIVCVIGANGAGQEHNLRAISRVVPVEKGSRMTFMGKDLLRYPRRQGGERAGHLPCARGQAAVREPDGPGEPPAGGLCRKGPGGNPAGLDRVFTIFPRLLERKNQKAGTLSGGEQQMLAVGRAFMSGRKVMLLDEPSMGLAPLLMLTVFESLRQINREEGTAVFLVEQNARLALQFAGRGYVLENGNLVLQGNSEDLLADPEVKKAYLGG